MNHACAKCGASTTMPGRCRDCARPENQAKAQRPTYQQVYSTKRWRTLRDLVLRRDGYRCQECGTYPANHAGHVHPFTDGTDPKAWSMSNVRCLCATCNGREAGVRRHQATHAA